MGNDRSHFDEFRLQTLVKHTILTKYLLAYFHVIKANAGENLVYVDGFAGRGSYTKGDGSLEDGSPIKVLKELARSDKLSKKVATIFIEKDPVLFKELAKSLQAFYDQNSHIREPQWGNEEFSTVMTAQLDGLEARGQKLAPAFLFVDPCGVAGVDFNVINRALTHQSKTEVFLFFNIDGVRRILGLQERMGATMENLLGTRERALELASRVAALPTPQAREDAIITFYEELLRLHTPAKYVVSFRVQREDRESTSHYLIHASQHPRGFAIMKDVMWGAGRTAEGKGGLALEQCSAMTLFTPEWDKVLQSVLSELQTGMKQVGHFTQLAEQPTNQLCTKAYKEALLELEANGKVVVWDKSGLGPAPPRIIRSGQLTLADAFHVRLP